MRKIHSSDETSNKKLPAFHRFEARPSGTDLENGPIDQSLSFWPSITSIRPFASRASTQNEPNRAKELVCPTRNHYSINLNSKRCSLFNCPSILQSIRSSITSLSLTFLSISRRYHWRFTFSLFTVSFGVSRCSFLSRLRKCNVGWQPVCWGKNLFSLIAGLLESTGSLWPGRTSIRVPHSCTVEDQLVIYCQKVWKPRRQAFQTELWMKKEGSFGNQQNCLRNQTLEREQLMNQTKAEKEDPKKRSGTYHFSTFDESPGS